MGIKRGLFIGNGVYLLKKNRGYIARSGERGELLSPIVLGGYKRLRDKINLSCVIYVSAEPRCGSGNRITEDTATDCHTRGWWV